MVNFDALERELLTWKQSLKQFANNKVDISSIDSIVNMIEKNVN